VRRFADDGCFRVSLHSLSLNHLRKEKIWSRIDIATTKIHRSSYAWSQTDRQSVLRKIYPSTHFSSFLHKANHPVAKYRRHVSSTRMKMA
jgi:hypothetical protein